MYSTLQRLNHLSSLATTYIMVLLGLISIASFLSIPSVDTGRIDVKDLIIRKGRANHWSRKEEELASLRFDLRTDLRPLLNSYNTKQLFLYLTASYTDDTAGASHDVVLWDRIIQRAELRDFRTVDKSQNRGKAKSRSSPKKGRGNVRVEEGKNTYNWKDPSGTFRNVPSANMTLYYSLMPYVGILSSGVAATAQGTITVPDLAVR